MSDTETSAHSEPTSSTPATGEAKLPSPSDPSPSDPKESTESKVPESKSLLESKSPSSPSIELTPVVTPSAPPNPSAPPRVPFPENDVLISVVASDAALLKPYANDGYRSPKGISSMKIEEKKDPNDTSQPKRRSPHLGSLIWQNLKWPYFLEWPLFWFPFVSNENSARIVSLLAAILIIIIIIFRTQIWAYYVTCALFSDYCMRFAFGSRGSFLGIAAEAVSRFLPKKFIPGAPKQFAALCGAMFSGWAAVGFWLNRANSPSSEDGATGSVLLGVLLGCCTLEAVMNFCVGCFFFGVLQRFGIISKQCNERTSYVMQEEMRSRTEIEDKPDTLMTPQHFELRSVPLGEGRSLSVTYKTSYEKWKRHNFHLIKQCKVGYFIIPVSATGLAVAWKFASDDSIFGTDPVVWQILGIFSLILYCLQFILYSLKLILHPSKVINEWTNLLSINGFILIPAGAILFIPLLIDNYEVMGRAVFWIFAPFVLLMSIIIVGKWIQQLYMTSIDLITPDFLLPIVANLICALCLPLVYTDYNNSQYNEPAYLWWSFSTFAYFLISSFLLFRIITGSILEDRARCSVFLYMCGSSLIGISYYAINGAWDSFTYFTLYLSYFFCLLYLFLGMNNYFCRHKWDVSYFSFAFPLETVSIFSMFHYQQEHDIGLVKAIATTLMVITNAIVVCQILFVVSSLTHRIALFTTELEEKFNPLSFMRLCHHAFREAFFRMSHMIPHIDTTVVDGVTVMNEDFEKFVRLTTALRVANIQHARWEDRYVFVQVRQWWPGTTDAVDKQHVEHDHHDTYAKILEMAETLKAKMTVGGEKDSGAVEEARATLAKTVKDFEDECQTHWKIEERHLLNRKFVNWQSAKNVVSAMVNDSPMHELKITLPFVVENQFIHSRRIKLIRSLLLSIPEQSQYVGKMIYEGINPFLWTRLIADVPQIAPKNTERYTKIL